MLRIIATILGLVTSSAIGLQIEASPHIVDVGETRNLTVKCSTTVESSSKMASLISLIISRSTDANDTNFKELNSINVFQLSGQVIENIRDNQTSTGVIDAYSQSNLSLVWEYPDASKTGLYKCEANGVDFAGHPVAISSTVLVVSVQSDSHVLMHELKNINTKIDVLNNVIESQNRTISNSFDQINSSIQKLEANQQIWNSRFQSIKKHMFTNWTDFENHQYLLSHIRSVVSVEDYETICELFGGYLVEIDSIAEFNFLRALVSSHPEFKYIMVGATDRATEDHWINIHSGTIAHNIQWGQGEPSHDDDYNCMLFSRAHHWYMYEWSCFFQATYSENGFICEISE
ncbi:uncharacterized protein LOC131957967 [Physella acuta]|uniref:uncharacterized protein LOC131957967 n=1 Tax=Physella acuta TaxID=109671 RepID=UPI0027DC0236|nr:uncharacterized protein LOC131957967 [Physella acuta]